jgi:hypothetical protein
MRALFLAQASPSTTRLSEGVVMDSWYFPAVPAALAVAIIGYSFFLAYA